MFLPGGQATFQVGESVKDKNPRENMSLKAKVRTLIMDKDLLFEKINRLEAGVAFPWKKSKC